MFSKIWLRYGSSLLRNQNLTGLSAGDLYYCLKTSGIELYVIITCVKDLDVLIDVDLNFCERIDFQESVSATLQDLGPIYVSLVLTRLMHLKFIQHLIVLS